MSTSVRMISIPGSVQFSPRVREQRTESYRTWRSPHPDMNWCWECLLCGQWESSQGTREAAQERAGVSHPGWCHVVTGCSCKYPHITARMAARLGIRDEYPAHLAAVLFRLAGGIRRPCPPCFDRNGTPHCDTAWAMVAAQSEPYGWFEHATSGGDDDSYAVPA